MKPTTYRLRSMDQLVRAGKIRHWALSNVPASVSVRPPHFDQHPSPPQWRRALMRLLPISEPSRCPRLPRRSGPS